MKEQSPPGIPGFHMEYSHFVHMDSSLHCPYTPPCIPDGMPSIQMECLESRWNIWNPGQFQIKYMCSYLVSAQCDFAFLFSQHGVAVPFLCHQCNLTLCHCCHCQTLVINNGYDSPPRYTGTCCGGFFSLFFFLYLYLFIGFFFCFFTFISLSLILLLSCHHHPHSTLPSSIFDYPPTLTP